MLKKLFSPPILFCIILFLALPVCISYQVQDSFVTPRVILVALSMFVLSLVLFFNAPQGPELLRNIPIVALLVFLLLFAISISKSLNPGDAWYEWIKSFLIFPVILVTAVLFSRYENRLTLLKFSQVCVIILSTFYCYQWIHFLTHRQLDIIFDLKVHIAATLGNKNFYAEVICLVFPLTCIAFFKLEKWWKRLSAVNIFLLFASLVLTQSYAVFAAFILATVLVFAVWYFTMPVRKFPGKKIIAIITAVVLVAGFGILKSSVVNNVGERVKTIQQYMLHPELADSTMLANSNSTYERIMLWRNSFSLIKENPITGSGANNWKLLYPKFGVGGTRYIEAGNVHYEHPHNDYLLVASESGIPAMIAFIIFLGSLGWVSFREIKRNSANRLWLAGTLFAATCFIIISLFAFPRMRFYGWILLGVHAGLLFSFYVNGNMKGDKKLIARWKYLMLVCAVIAAWSVTAGISRFAGEAHSKSMQLAKKQKNFARVIREAEKASSVYFPIDETATPFTWYKGMALFYSGEIPQAKVAYEDALKKNPYHIQLLNDLATTYEQTNEREKAVEMYQRALSVTPYFPHTLLNISACYFNIGKKDSAYIFIDKIYGIRLTFQQQKSYGVYLPAILREKIYADSAFFNTEIRQQVLKLATDTGFVDAAYRVSKRKNESFLETLTGMLQSR